MNKDTYLMPKHGWTCFFCGETLTTPGAAKDHFGGEPLATAACQIKAGDEKGLLMELRKCEAELERYRNEDSDLQREMYGLIADHQAALISVEQKGYDKGLADQDDSEHVFISKENAFCWGCGKEWVGDGSRNEAKNHAAKFNHRVCWTQVINASENTGGIADIEKWNRGE